jgi:hypothetical protein
MLVSLGGVVPVIGGWIAVVWRIACLLLELHEPLQSLLTNATWPLLPAVLFFGNKLTMQTKIGTLIALAGTWLYTETTKKPAAPAAPAAPKTA